MGGVWGGCRVLAGESLRYYREADQRFFDKDGAVEEIVLEALLKNAKRRLRKVREDITKYQDYEKECAEEVRFLRSLVNEKPQDEDDLDLTSEE